MVKRYKTEVPFWLSKTPLTKKINLNSGPLKSLLRIFVVAQQTGRPTLDTKIAAPTLIYCRNTSVKRVGIQQQKKAHHRTQNESNILQFIEQLIWCYTCYTCIFICK